MSVISLTSRPGNTREIWTLAQVQKRNRISRAQQDSHRLKKSRGAGHQSSDTFFLPSYFFTPICLVILMPLEVQYLQNCLGKKIGFFTNTLEKYGNMYSLLNVIFHSLFFESIDAPRDNIFVRGHFSFGPLAITYKSLYAQSSRPLCTISSPSCLYTAR